MIKCIENLNNEYGIIKNDYKNNIYSLENAITYLKYLLSFESLYVDKYINFDGIFYNNKFLKFKSEECIDIVDTQKRILDGFKYDINLLLEFVNENNYSEIVELANFIFEKLRVNMWATEGKKTNLVSQQYFPSQNPIKMRKYPEDDSLFVESFFVEKLCDITSIDILSLKK